MIETLLRWFRRGRSEPPKQRLSLSPSCSTCGAPAARVELVELAEGWHLIFEGVAGGGNGGGDPVADDTARAIRDALSPPYKSTTIRAAGFYDDFGYCLDCEAFYCATHWQVSTTGGGTCPAGHWKSLDPHWHPD